MYCKIQSIFHNQLYATHVLGLYVIAVMSLMQYCKMLLNVHYPTSQALGTGSPPHVTFKIKWAVAITTPRGMGSEFPLPEIACKIV